MLPAFWLVLAADNMELWRRHYCGVQRERGGDRVSLSGFGRC